MKDEIQATVADQKVTVARSDVKKQNTFQKFLAMLATTILQVRTTTREDIVTGQINVPAANAYPSPIVPANSNRTSVILRNTGGNDAYIGSYGVTITTGFLIKKDETITLDRSWGAIFAVSTAGTTISYIEE